MPGLRRLDLGVPVLRRLPPQQATAWTGLLDAALARHPDDVDALEAKALGALAFGNEATARTALDRLLA